MNNKHIYNLTGIRALAALWVVFHHGFLQLHSNHENISAFLFNLSEKGWMGVDLFFILSGFVMTFVHYQDFNNNISKDKMKNYMFRRFSRVYPVHLFCTLILIALYLISIFILKTKFDHGNFTFSKLLYTLTLTNGLGIPESTGWNLPSWSLGAEFLAYLCFPFIINFFIKSIDSLKWLISMIVAIMLFKISLALVINHGEKYFLSESFTVLRVLSCFTTGTLLLKIYRKVKLNLRIADFLSLSSFVLIVILTQIDITLLHLYFYEILFILLIFSLSYDGPISKVIFGNKLAIYLGKTSFSLYMIHSIVLILFKQISKKYIGHESILFIVYITACYLAVYPIYEIIENKSRIALMRWYES
jgi:peptidoglycan/LPS O-acetylase OafA/YrhL